MNFQHTLSARGSSFPLQGRIDPAFRKVADAFIENFTSEEEVGAGASVMIQGKTVVDLWGGWRNSAQTQAWEEHSTVCMMSVAKGITVREAVIDLGYVERGEVTEAQLDAALDLLSMTRPPVKK